MQVKYSPSVKHPQSIKKIKTWVSLWQPTETHLDRQQTMFVVQVMVGWQRASSALRGDSLSHFTLDDPVDESVLLQESRLCKVILYSIDLFISISFQPSLVTLIHGRIITFVFFHLCFHWQSHKWGREIAHSIGLKWSTLKQEVMKQQ